MCSCLNIHAGTKKVPTRIVKAEKPNLMEMELFLLMAKKDIRFSELRYCIITLIFKLGQRGLGFVMDRRLG